MIPERAKTSAKKEWLFRFAAALGVPLLLLMLLEVLLRVAGFGFPTGFFLRKEINGRDSWIQNDRFAERFFPRALARAPVSLSFPVNKATNAIRIFVLGESAAQGDPLPRFGFPRMLQRLLQERFPEKQIEVINAGVTAINSHAILPIARDCTRREGDFWVVYMGNNEVVGPFGAGTVFGAQMPSLAVARAQVAVRALRLGQIIEQAAASFRSGNAAPQYWKGMELFSEQRVARSDPKLEKVYAHFERNLNDILDTGARAGVSVLLCTVAVNLRDSPPFASAHRAGLSAEDRAAWQRSYDEAIGLEAEEKWSEALSRYRDAEKLDPEFAELQFRLGRCLLALGRAEAREHFRRAVDHDTLRFRADSEINRIIRGAATARSTSGVRLLDIEAITAQKSPEGIPGRELFYEHVHLTSSGNFLLAGAAAEEIARQLGGSTAEDAIAETRSLLTQGECEARIGFTRWDQSRALRIILDRMKFPPFAGTFDYTNRLRDFQERIAELADANSPAAVKQQAEDVLRAARLYPQDWELREHAGVLLSIARDFPRAIEELQAAIRLMPHASGPYFSLAGVLSLQGRTDEAIRYYQECLRLKPGDFDVFMRLGIIELGRRGFKEAIAYFRAALEANPASVAARVRLAAALWQERHRAEAEEHLLQALKLEPDNVEAQQLLQIIRSGKAENAKPSELKK